MKTNVEDMLLELVREKPLLQRDLRAELKLSNEKMVAVTTFLEKDKLIEIIACSGDGDVNEAMVWITAKGRELLELPDLPTKGLPSKDPKQLYTHNQLTESNNWIISMAMRYDVSADDVIHALWLDGKSTVWAKLEQDIKEKKSK